MGIWNARCVDQASEGVNEGGLGQPLNPASFLVHEGRGVVVGVVCCERGEISINRAKERM